MNDAYRLLIGSKRVSTPTREALEHRGRPDDSSYRAEAMTAAELLTLRAVVDCVIPQGECAAFDIAARLDAGLASGRGDGWRFAALPPDAQTYRAALATLDALAENLGGCSLCHLPAHARRTLLEAISRSSADAPAVLPAINPTSGQLDANQMRLWVSDLYADAVRMYVAHPQTLAKLAYSGIANGGDGLPKTGFVAVGLNLREAWEPVAVPPERDEPDDMRRYGGGETVDAVVVGTGAGAAPLLASLAGAGRSVVALEAGRNWDPEIFPADEIAAAGIYWLDERLAAGEGPHAYGGNNSGTGVGGSTLHWGAFCPRADVRDLRLRSESGAGADWPISYEELLPYYQIVEKFVGVSGPAEYPWDSTRRYPLPPVLRNAPAELMHRGCAALGVRTSDAPAAVVSRDFAQSANFTRPACINCGACHQGCRIGAKTSMDVTYLPLAVSRGAEIREQCVVHGVELNERGRVNAVVYRHGGIDHRQPCRAVVLCGGAVETPRLLLHLDLANSSGQVGRNFMSHVASQVWGTFEEETRPNKGYPSSLITEDLIRPADADFAGGYLVQSLGILPVTWAQQVARGRRLLGQPLLEYLQRYNHVAGLGINGECVPQAGNYLELSDELDAIGVPKAKIHFSYGPNEKKIDRHAVRFMTRVWEEAGATDIWSLQRSAHTIGTCRMGKDARSAVVDHEGRSFDIDNLWICDNSVFPSALAANPALTIMALSLRTAAAFLRSTPPHE